MRSIVTFGGVTNASGITISGTGTINNLGTTTTTTTLFVSNRSIYPLITTFIASNASSVPISSYCGGYLIKDGKEVELPYSLQTIAVPTIPASTATTKIIDDPYTAGYERKRDGIRAMDGAMGKFVIANEEKKIIIEAVKAGKKDQVLRYLQTGKFILIAKSSKKCSIRQTIKLDKLKVGAGCGNF